MLATTCYECADVCSCQTASVEAESVRCWCLSWLSSCGTEASTHDRPESSTRRYTPFCRRRRSLDMDALRSRVLDEEDKDPKDVETHVEALLTKSKEKMQPENSSGSYNLGRAEGISVPGPPPGVDTNPSSPSRSPTLSPKGPRRRRPRSVDLSQ